MISQVEEFFRKNEKSRELAYQAKKLLQSKYFPKCSVYYSYDFDLDIKKEIVWIVIRTNLTCEEAYQRLEEFDEWWIPALIKSGGKLSLTIKSKDYF